MWPASERGLTSVPQSCTAMYLGTCTSPVCGVDLDDRDVAGVADRTDRRRRGPCGRRSASSCTGGRRRCSPRGRDSISSGRLVLEQVGLDRDVGERLALLRRALAPGRRRRPSRCRPGGLEQVRGDLERLVLDACCAAPSTAPASITVVRLPPGPVRGQPVARAGVDDADVVRLAAELLGDELRDHRLRAVAPERARVQRRREVAGRADAQRDALGHRGHGRGRLVEPEPELGRR